MLLTEQQSSGRFRAAHFSHLRHLALFALVVQSGSFSVAAQRLGLGRSSVSRQISELESFVGSKLLNRSTRALSLTDEGRMIIRECERLIDAATDALDRLDGDLPLAGTLRLASTVEHGQYVLPPIIAEFTEKSPGVDVELVLGDAFIDLVDHGIDLAIRVGSPGPSPQYIMKKISELQYKLYAHQDLVAAHGPISTPRDAEGLTWLLHSGGRERGHWTFHRDGEITEINVGSRIITNSFNARIELAKQGGHLIAIPDFIPKTFLGPKLKTVLPDYEIVPKQPIYAVYPDARFLSPKVAEFLQLLTLRHP